MAFFTTRVSDTYFVIIDDKATVACVFELQLTSLLFNMKTKPEDDFFVAWSPV